MELHNAKRCANIVVIFSMVFALFAFQIKAVAQSEWVPVRGHISTAAMSSRMIAHTAAQTTIPLAVALHLRNEASLDDLLKRLYDPKDSLYGRFLSTSDFVDRYSPTSAEYTSVVQYLRSMGLSVTGLHANRLIVDAVGTAATVERAFGVNMYNFRTADGREFYAPTSEPQVASSIAGKITAIAGLDSSPHWATHGAPLSPEVASAIQPWQVGHGPGGALTPSDIAKAYSLTGLTVKGTTTTLNGAGQTIAVFELDGYHPTDITKYCSYYGLRSTPLQAVLVDGYSGNAGSNSGEVTLDIELAIAMAQGASKVLVYEAPNTTTGVIDEYNKIAVDNVAKQVSSSWGLPESSVGSGALNAESNIFKQMAAQGQSMFAASGDSGAYDNRSSLSVDDPGAQPYVTCVGGTQLFLNSDGSYKRETTWDHGTIQSGAGGGGVSAVWAKPSWQNGFGVSKTMRNVPDVSLNADPFTGYSIYWNNGWYIYGGTSCAAPLWAGFTALLNQQRAALGKTAIGFFNPAIYGLCATSAYSTDFHDIADGSTNLYFPAVKGYDDATGWGTFNGTNLLNDLSGVVARTPTLTIVGGPTASPTLISARITWSTSLAANSTVYFGGAATSLTRVVSNGSQTTSHSLTLTGLLHRRTYYYVVTSTSSVGSVSSTLKWFTTP
jgi:kumamolisin